MDYQKSEQGEKKSELHKGIQSPSMWIGSQKRANGKSGFETKG